MTVTSAPSGPSVARRRASARVVSIALRSLAVATVLAVIAVIVPLSASPAVALPAASANEASAATPSPTPTQSTGVTQFTLAPVSNGTVRAGDTLAVSISLENGTTRSTAPVTVTLSLGAAPLGDRAGLSSWLAGDTAGVAVTAVATAEVAGVAPGEQEVTPIVIAADDPILAGRAPGVYPLVASYTSDAGTVISTSTMIVPDEAAEAVGVGVVVPITADATGAGLLTSVELAELTSATGSLTDQLDAVEGTTAILAVDPAIAAAIRVLGSSAPATATEWLARLESLTNSRFALQFGDADIASQLQAGITRPMAPQSLQAYMNPADFVAKPGPPTPSPTPTTASPTPTSTETAEPVDDNTPVYPTLTELTEIGDARSGIYWPATGTATPTVVADLGAVLTDDRESLTLVPSTSTQAGSAGATVAGRATAGDADLLVYDADVSRELNAASDIPESSLRGAPLTAAAAYLAFATAETDGAPLLVTIDRGDDRSRIAMRTAITTASQNTGVTPLTLGGLAAASPVNVEIVDAPVDQARVDAASAFVADEASIARFATILDDVTLLTGPERAEILQLLGTAWQRQPDEWPAALAQHREQTVTTLDSVGILPPTPANLISSDAPIPIWVRNDLQWPVNVVLYATPDDLRLDVTRETEVTAGPQSNTRVQVQVQTRVGTGEVTVQLQLRSRTLEPIGAAQAVEVNVRAEWEGVGITVLAVLVGGFLLIGVIRTVLRLRRRSRKANDATPDADAPESDAGADEAPR